MKHECGDGIIIIIFLSFRNDIRSVDIPQLGLANSLLGGNLHGVLACISWFKSPSSVSYVGGCDESVVMKK